ncbi:MAG: hypothetical protein J6I98_00510 [Clostridia bacterium]|nr:hypothetical protein [Clostridia bacterium]
MKIKNKQISVRKLLCVAIGWLHCALIFAPIYTLLVSFVNNEIPREEVYAGYLRGLLILVPVIISWFAKRYLKNAALYILVSFAATMLTGWLFDSAIMLVPAVAICFLRFYNRIQEEKEISLLDQPGYAGIALVAIPFAVSIFEERLDSAFQSLTLLYMAIYFILCFAHHGIERINDYVGVNKGMSNMPSRRITRVAAVILAGFVLVFSVILLPTLFGAEINIRYEAKELEYEIPEAEFVTPEGQDAPTDMDGGLPGQKETPLFSAIYKLLEFVFAIVFGVGGIIAIVYAVIQITRRFNQSSDERGDFIENLQEDDLEVVRERRAKSDKPRFFDRSPNAMVRRKYKKTILRAAKNQPYAWMTPAEVEAHAELTGERIEALHALYEKARYSPEGCTKQDTANL